MDMTVGPGNDARCLKPVCLFSGTHEKASLQDWNPKMVLKWWSKQQLCKLSGVEVSSFASLKVDADNGLEGDK